VTIIDPGPAVARELRRRLEMRQLLSDSTAAGRTRYWTSADPDHLKQVVKNFYTDDIEVGTLPAA
jgi:glutamate racemase